MTARCCAASPTARPATPLWWPGHSWTSSVSGTLSMYVLCWYKIQYCNTSILITSVKNSSTLESERTDGKRFSLIQWSNTNIAGGVDVFCPRPRHSSRLLSPGVKCYWARSLDRDHSGSIIHILFCICLVSPSRRAFSWVKVATTAFTFKNKILFNKILCFLKCESGSSPF